MAIQNIALGAVPGMALCGLVAAAQGPERAGEVEIVTAYLAGTLRQRRTGVGWRGVADLPEPASAPSVGLTEVDAALDLVCGRGCAPQEPGGEAPGAGGAGTRVGGGREGRCGCGVKACPAVDHDSSSLTPLPVPPRPPCRGEERSHPTVPGGRGPAG